MKVVFCWDEFDQNFTHFALGLFYTKVKPNKNVFQMECRVVRLILLYLSSQYNGHIFTFCRKESFEFFHYLLKYNKQ